jgi:ABC-type phosphate transport system substrate-binding protein
MSKEQVRKIFKGRLKLIDGHRVQPILPEEDAAKKTFLSEYIQMSSSQYKRHWSKMIFTGKAKKITSLSGSNQVIQAIKDNVHAISYIKAEDYSDQLNKYISILEVK